VYMHNEVVAYYRVSTLRQGQSGLGLEAQRRAVAAFVAQNNRTLVNEYQETESGKRIANRPQLQAALAECARRAATLVIAKLDRLARNLHFITGLMETEVDFVACDIPTANRFMLHIYAAVGEEERRLISERTKAALATCGKKLGSPNGVARNRENARLRAEAVRERIAELRSAGVGSIRGLAGALGEHPTQVARILKRLDEVAA
jgi:DNA invertase Pin-like site-specific DNA recombinase